jgi:hypothetical protein
MVQRAGILTLGALSLVLGCAQPGVDSLETESDPAAEPLTSGGSSGTNGLSSADYRMYENALNTATSQALVTGGAGSTVVTNPVIIQQLLGTPEGRVVFKYAVGCALRSGLTVSYADRYYVGGGHLLTTINWLNAPLSADARHDLLGCMAAHVNPLGIHVPIVLWGQPVADDGGDHSAFDVEEAVWLVNENVIGYREYNVWPLPAFAAACQADPWLALQQRVCGQNPVGCALRPRKDLTTACVVDASGAYFCDGKPAIKTTLTTEGLSDLYSGSSACKGK